MPFVKDIVVRAQKGAITTYNNLYVWGANGNGQLGTGDTNNRSSPVLVTSNAGPVAASVAGYSHFIKNGGLYAMGNNSVGQLGIGTFTNRSSPVQVGAQTYWYFVANSNGYGAHTLALSDQTGQTKLWAWGLNNTGELGHNNQTSRSSPVQVGTQTDWIYATAGNASSFGIRLIANSAGTLWAWGDNYTGQLGLNDTNSRSSPVQIGAGENWIVIDAGENHVLALDNGGTDLYVWGGNTSGQLGLSDTTARSSPVLLASDGYLSISAGFYFSGIVKTDGTLWMWGSNSNGELGLGDTTGRSSPVQVGAGTDWHRVKCGGSHTIAMKTDGTIWAWGNNSAGALGDGTLVSKSSPIQIGSLTSWKIAQEIFEGHYFDAGADYSIAIETPP